MLSERRSGLAESLWRAGVGVWLGVHFALSVWPAIVACSALPRVKRTCAASPPARCSSTSAESWLSEQSL